MDTTKLPINKLSIQLAVFTILFAALVLPSGVYSNPSDVIIEFPAGYETSATDSAITFDSVRNELSADGEWIKVNQDEIDSESVTDGSVEFDDDINTEYVWRPKNVDENWSPYTNGHWTYTNCGWMWVSYYEWGWRPYHYGRWWWSPRWGWVWSPGFVWAPAWVVWMFYDDYYGWYPLSPRVRWRHHRHHHHHGYYSHHMRYRVRHWVFCHNYNFHNVPINHTVIIDPYYNPEILKHSKFASDIEYANGIVKNTGPEVREIEKSAGKKINAEDVTKYNTTKKVNEIVKRSAEEKQKIENKINEKQAYQEKRENSTNNEKQVNKEEKKSTREDDWEKNPYYGPPKETKEKKSEEKKNENVNKKEEKNNNTNRNENYNKTETPKQKAPKQERKNESPPQNKGNNEKKEDNRSKQNSSKQNNSKQNNSKSNEGAKQDRNNR